MRKFPRIKVMENLSLASEKGKPSWLFEDYLKAPGSKACFFLILAFIYFLGARLGHLLSISPGNVTPIWPPSGIALAATLMYGYRVWPGILIGAMIGTTWAFFDFSSWDELLKTSFTGILIAIGVTLQALVGAYFIQRCIALDELFKRPIHVVKFFIISICSCIIGSTIGSLALVLFGLGEWERYLTIWITWIVGDSAGILVMTPFILVWFKRPLFTLRGHKLFECILLVLLLLITARMFMILPYSLGYIFLPFLIWGSFRFGPHGATSTLLAISLIANTLTIFGYGSFVHISRNDSLIAVQFYIAIVGLTGLMMSSLLQQLDEYNRRLEEKVREKTFDLEQTIHQLKDMQDKIIVQEKLSSLGLITAGIAHEIKNPLNFVNNFSSLSLDLLKDLKKSLLSHASLVKEETESLHVLDQNIHSILEQGKKADTIIQKLLTLGVTATRELQPIDIHQFLDETISLTYFAFKGQSSILVEIQKNYDSTVPKIQAVPDDITRVFINLLNNAFYALEAKSRQMHEGYIPSLLVTTKNLGKSCEIIIRDNGIGISEKESHNIFTPFFTTKSPGQGVGLGLSLSRDVIVNEHTGKLYFRSEEGSFTEFIIELPLNNP